ncbi:MAG: NAD(P)H-dependent oxidoreductase [Solirubrobacterales bacterium]|nr:NAD(P)H-dependent oxidoreductase [Solirubrobacterales bacterium]
MLRILGISGSLREGSHNTNLLRAAAGELPPEVEFVIYDGLRELPPYDADRDLDGERADPAVAKLREAIAGADGVVIATPEFNGSIPGVLKNALDWASRPFPDNSLRGKPVAVIGASTGLFGAVWAQAETRKVLGVIGADVIDRELPIGAAETAFAGDGRLLDAEQHAALANLVGVLAERAVAAGELGAGAGKLGAAA